MASQSDEEYYATRAAVERQLSDTAADPSTALIHAQLASRYELLAKGHDSPGISLQLVGGTEVASASGSSS